MTPYQNAVDTLVERKFLFFFLALAVFSLNGAGLLQDREFDASDRAVLAESDPYKAEIEETQADYPSTPNVTFVFEAKPDIFTEDGIRAIQALSQRFGEIDAAVSAGTILNHRLNPVDQAKYGRDFLFPDPSTLDEKDLQQIREIALADENLTGLGLSEVGDLSTASVRYLPQNDEQETRLTIARSIITLRDSLRNDHPNVDVYAIFGPLWELERYEGAQQDNRILRPIIAILGILFLYFCLRSILYSVALFVIAAASSISATATFAWLQIPFNSISNFGPLVVTVVALAHGVHVVSVFVQELSQGRSKIQAMKESVRVNLQPVALATVTTMMGFLSLNYCSSPGIYEFGNVIAVGVAWAFFFTFALLPALILLFPVSRIPKPLGTQRFISAIQGLVASKSRVALFWGFIALILATLTLLPLNKLDFDRLSFIDEDSDVHYILTAARERINGGTVLSFVIESGEYYGITDPAFLQNVDRFSKWLETLPEATFVGSYTDYLKSRNKAEHDDDEAWNILPTDRLQIIDYLVGYQLIQEIDSNFPRIFNADYSSVRLVIGAANPSNEELLAFNRKIDAWIEENLDDGYQVLHADNSVRFARQDSIITRELMQGFLLSFVLITITMILGLKSLRYGLLSIMPNVFPVTIVFGFWGLFVGTLSPYTLMLFAISLGLVVDDSVHVLSKYISARKTGENPEKAIAYSIDRAGSAITITTATLAAGIYLLTLSSSPLLSNVASLISPIVITALFLDILWLPEVLRRFDGWWDRRHRA